MDVTELSDQQALRQLRAEYQRMETKLQMAQQQLAALLWCHGPLALPVDKKHIPKDLRINQRRDGKNVVLSAIMTTARVIA